MENENAFYIRASDVLLRGGVKGVEKGRRRRGVAFVSLIWANTETLFFLIIFFIYEKYFQKNLKRAFIS